MTGTLNGRFSAERRVIVDKVVPGRFTARTDGPFVVFIIGLRINRLLDLRRWVPTARAMFPMLRELYRHPEKGFLHAETYVGRREVMMVQYWRSFEDLERFARDPEASHMPAWQRFNREARQSGSVGIWHETYLVEPGHYEALYANMPVSGLAKATEHVPAVGGRETARRRLLREKH